MLKAEKIKTHHNKYWGKLSKIIDLSYKNKHLDSLNEIWDTIVYYELTGKEIDPNNFVPTREQKNKIPALFGSNRCVHESFEEYKRDKKHVIFDNIPPDCTSIIDMGSGWGRYSFLLAAAFPNKKVFSLEYSKGGKKVCNALKKRYGLKNLYCYNFDYNRPWSLKRSVLSKLSQCEKLFYFSSYSIEQVPYIKISLFNTMLNSPHEVKCLHMEPVGWQIDSTRIQTRKHQYNQNLWEILLELQSQKKISINNFSKDCFGKRSNPGTLIQWEKLND